MFFLSFSVVTNSINDNGLNYIFINPNLIIIYAAVVSHCFYEPIYTPRQKSTSRCHCRHFTII